LKIDVVFVATKSTKDMKQFIRERAHRLPVRAHLCHEAHEAHEAAPFSLVSFCAMKGKIWWYVMPMYHRVIYPLHCLGAHASSVLHP
jgi:hypothetical protein